MPATEEPRVSLSEPARSESGERVMDVRGPGGRTIGQVSYRNLDVSRSRAELGIEIKEPYRDQGYGTEAIRLLLTLLFEHHGLDTVYLRVRDYNHQARRAYERVGFRYTRTVRWPLVGIVRYLVMEINRLEFESSPDDAPRERR